MSVFERGLLSVGYHGLLHHGVVLPALSALAQLCLAGILHCLGALPDIPPNHWDLQTHDSIHVQLQH